jgi:hypothetical protein
VEWSLADSPRIRRLWESKKSNAEILDDFFLATLSRPPKDTEKKKFLAYFAEEKNREQAVRDILWALLNCDEFLLNH